MRRIAAVAVLLVGVTGAGCYHATIDTGLAPSTETITQPWAMSFVAGLVPPPLVETAAKCPNGVSKVETQHSFLNVLVAAVTASIVTPIDIRVTCAARRTSLAPVVPVPASGGEDALTRALQLALQRSEQRSQPVYVQVVQ